MDRHITEIEQRFADLLPLNGQELAAVFDEVNHLREENAALKAKLIRLAAVEAHTTDDGTHYVFCSDVHDATR